MRPAILTRSGWVLLAWLAAPLAPADTLLTVKEGARLEKADADIPAALRESLGGEPQTVRYWSRPQRMARIDANGRMISRLDRGETYLVNDQNRTCLRIGRRDAAPEAEATPAKFRNTGASEPIGPWQTDRYELTVDDGEDAYEVTIWVSEALSPDLAGHRAYLKSIATAKTAWTLGAFDLGGFPVRQEVRFGPILSWSELVSVSEASAPAGAYEIPAGYQGCD